MATRAHLHGSHRAVQLEASGEGRGAIAVAGHDGDTTKRAHDAWCCIGWAGTGAGPGVGTFPSARTTPFQRSCAALKRALGREYHRQNRQNPLAAMVSEACAYACEVRA